MTLVPVSHYLLTNGTITQAALEAAESTYNIEMFHSGFLGYFGYSPRGSWADIPDIKLSKRPRRVESVEYADYSTRTQGPWEFTWGFPYMSDDQFEFFCYICGLTALTADNIRTALVTAETRVAQRNLTGGLAGTSTWYAFNATVIRPEIDISMNAEQGGYNNVLWRFVGGTLLGVRTTA